MNSGLTDGVGRQALRMASELECRGVYLGSCRMGCILKGCLLFIDIMTAEVREGRCPSSSFHSVLMVFLKRNASERKKTCLPRADNLEKKIFFLYRVFVDVVRLSKKKNIQNVTIRGNSGTPADLLPPVNDFYNKDAPCLQRLYWTTASQALPHWRILTPSPWTSPPTT